MPSPAAARAQHRRDYVVGALLLLMITAGPVAAQRTPLVGSVGPAAIGAPAPSPTPVGGLRTRPLATPDGNGTALPAGNWLRLRVADAPTAPAGVVVLQADPPPPPIWWPSADPPTWVPDTTAEPSPLWRSLLVRDRVCTRAGRCIPRTVRVRARWVARCDCYAFPDALGRVWIVAHRP